MKINKKLILAGTMLLAIFILPGCTKSRVEKFSRPDIKDDFCGVVMNYQYCKCAFHNEFCDSVGLSSSAADNYVNEEYDKWVDGLLQSFKDNCEISGGIYSKEKCEYCEEPYYKEGNKCVKSDEQASESNDNEDTSFVPDGPLNNDCTVRQPDFDNDWKKYSDFDYRLEPGARSWEVQQHAATYEKIIELMGRNVELERDMEIDREMRLALRDYKKALVENLRKNLIKATTRLAYITYTTVKSGIGTGQSYGKVLFGTEQIEKIGAALKVFQASIPANSKLAIDTSDAKGKVASIGINAALEAIESMGDVSSVVKQLATDSRNAILPSADITQEEFDILRDQRITNQFLTEAIADSYRENALRRQELLANKKEIERLEAEANSWEAKEKSRVRSIIEEACREKKDQQKNDTSWLFVKKALAQENQEDNNDNTKAPEYTTIKLGDYDISYTNMEENDGVKMYYWQKDSDDKTLVMSVYDNDQNGQDDLWLVFDDEAYLTLEIHDTTGDGQPDTFVEIDKDENVSKLVQPESENMPIDGYTDQYTNDGGVDFVKDSSESKNKIDYLWFVLVVVIILAIVGLKKYRK